jgi:glycosyltransferase involved in cell wall biosynthesis
MTTERRPAVTVVIASTCEARRADAIRRAVHSVKTQEGVDVNLVFVVNGKRYDQTLADTLQEDPQIAVHYLDEPSYPAAVSHGRTLVTTEYFSFLDDDDEFLPGALLMRVTPMLADSSVDFVATNGYLCCDGVETIAYGPSTTIEQEPLAELLRANWMTPCGNMFRSSTVTRDYFEGATRYFEWTIIAFRLAMKLKLRFIDSPTYRKHDTPDSLFKSAGTAEGSVEAIETMMALHTSPSLRDRMIEIRTLALHAASDSNRRLGNYRRAWSFHLRSLRSRYGWRHLLYTRKLLPLSRRRET